MFPPQPLLQGKIDLCHKTISTNTFYMLVGDALVSNKPLSVVRMGDGERHLIKAARQGNPNDLVTYIDQPDPEGWLRRLGCYGIPNRELISRLEMAANECTYFGPSLSGIQHESYDLYDLFNPRKEYVDNFFCNAWTEEMKIQLFKTAKHVLFIHRNTSAADAMQIRAKYALDVKVTYLRLESWEQADDIIVQGSRIDAPLVIFSAGPASKYIGPALAKMGRNRVTLDIGNAADYWLLYSLKDIPNGRR